MPDPKSAPIIRPKTPSEYARCVMDILAQHRDDQIKVDVVLLLFSMFDGHHIENAVLYASGEAYGIGVMRMDSPKEVYQFLDSVSPSVIYASFIKGEFHIYQYPYFSKSRNQWVFLPVIDPRGLPKIKDKM